MTLISVREPYVLDDDRQGIQFTMRHEGLSLSVLVSSHALDRIDPADYGDARLERFNEYRGQFETIASNKFDRGLAEQDGTVCVRGRDLPCKGY